MFSLGSGGSVDLVLAVDRTFSVPPDTRALGLMVQGIEIIDANALQQPIDAEGWYDWEYEEYFPSRWMGLEAMLLVPGSARHGRRFATLPVRCDVDDGSQTLTIANDSKQVSEIRLLHGWHVYDLALPVAAADVAGIPDPLALTFSLNRLLSTGSHPSDRRDLGVRVGALELHDDARRHELARRFYDAAWRHTEDAAYRGAPLDRARRNSDAYFPEDGEGWYQWEVAEGVALRSMAVHGHLRVPISVHGGRRFCSFEMYSDSDDLSRLVTISTAGTITELPVGSHWNCVSLELGQPRTGDLDIAFDETNVGPAPHARQDDAAMTIGVGALLFHDDEARHRDARILYENTVLNTREFLSGAVVLESFPQSLGVDLYGKCNIKPPCVYCWWEDAKDLEGQSTGAVVDDRTLEDYGMFFRGATSLVNCSFGEPLLHPRLEQILRLASAGHKSVELATNGQAFTPESVAAVGGKRVALYVSIDAASAEVYRRLRNDRWHDVIVGLTFLRTARRRGNGCPQLNMVFMPLRANLQDLEAYFRLCRMVEADSLVIRPLARGNKKVESTDRGGYHFDYAAEMLSAEEMSAVAKRCREYSMKYSVPVKNQADFGRESERPLERSGSGADGQ